LGFLNLRGFNTTFPFGYCLKTTILCFVTDFSLFVFLTQDSGLAFIHSNSS
jgi:hypothetical protein